MKKLKLQTPKQKIHTMTSHPADADASAVSLAAKVVKNDHDEKIRSESSAAKRAPVVAAEVS